ncbi:glycosyltransferase [Domibacillus tundrae]|uniref:glycosyltransferase n=1 Tax=Domibacillus tundrae TaxID=1587527 RepID=UPI0033960461
MYIAQKRPDFTGTVDQIRAYQQISSLLKRNYCVYCLFQENDSIFLVEGEEVVRRGMESIYAKKTGPLYFAMLKSYLFKRYPLSTSLHSFPEIRRTVKHIMQEVRFDIIHIQSNMVHNFPDIDSWTEPVVVDYMDAISLSLERRYRWTSQLVEKTAMRGELGRVRKYQSYLKGCTANGIVSSEADRNHLAPVTIEKLDVVPNYVDDSLFSTDIHIPKKTAIVFAGPLNQPEYADAAIRLVKDIFPALKLAFPGLECWIAGSDLSAEVKKLARVEGVVLIEEPEAARKHVWEAAAYVSPLRFGYGQKTSILEAAALGCPIILSHIANEGIEFTSGKEVLLADTDEQFIFKTKLMLSDRIKRLFMANQARSFVRTFFSEKRIIDQLVHVYTKVEKQVECNERERA